MKDGKLVVGDSGDYYNSRASRTCVGITADNRVVLMVMDGRQEPVSAGGSAIEIAQVMLDAGCVVAVNLDAAALPRSWPRRRRRQSVCREPSLRRLCPFRQLLADGGIDGQALQRV